MFKDYYGFSKNTFEKQGVFEKDAFMSNDHKEATSRLNYLKNIRGIGLLTSPPGFGKTFALRCFSRALDKNLHEVAYISLSTVKLNEFYKQFCDVLGIEAPYGKTAMFKAIQDRLYHLFKDKKRPFLLLIDEAHELSTPILKDLKMILNYDYDSINCFTLILAGESYLKNTLEKPIHEALRQRIVIHYSFNGLSDLETEAYILHKLKVAGAADSILGEGTLPAIIGYAQGRPRLIDNLMNEALMLGAQLDKPSIDVDIIMAASNNLALS